MPAPLDLGFPVKRPGAILSAAFVNGDDELALEVGILDAMGQPRVTVLPLKTATQAGVMCLPGSATVTDLTDEALIAHIRMATWISKTVAGSKEWEAAFVEQESANFQTAIGTVKVVAVRTISEALIEIDVKKGTSGPTKTIQTDHNTISNYRLEPEEQVRVIPGAVEVQYSSYVHDHPSNSLSQAQKDNIVAYVLGLSLWM